MVERKPRNLSVSDTSTEASYSSASEMSSFKDEFGMEKPRSVSNTSTEDSYDGKFEDVPSKEELGRQIAVLKEKVCK
jgi:hypothetical protein